MNDRYLTVARLREILAQYPDETQVLYQGQASSWALLTSDLVLSKHNTLDVRRPAAASFETDKKVEVKF